MRWLAVIGAVAWIALVIVVAAASDMGTASAILFGILGLMLVAVLVVGLTMHKLLLRVESARTTPVPAKVPAKGGGPQKLADEDVNRISGLVDKELKRTFRQVEALQNLFAILPIEHALPASRGFPASRTCCCSW